MEQEGEGRSDMMVGGKGVKVLSAVGGMVGQEEVVEGMGTKGHRMWQPQRE